MLRSLDIRDMLIIDRLELAFQPGLNVLTGETGAGKSILLDSLGFVLGWRGRAELVRQGADQGEVIAEFDLAENHAAWDVLREAGFRYDDALILRRINGRDGRKTAWINDRRVSGDILRAVSETLVELHGQHDDHGLLNPRGHRVLLDDFGNLAPRLAAVRATWKDLSAAKKTLAAAEMRVAELEAEEEFLRHSVAELDGLSPSAGEDAELDKQRRKMQAAEKIGEDIHKAYQSLGINGAEGQLGDAMRWLGDAAGQADGTLEAPLAALERAMIELGEAQSGVETCIAELAFNPHDLEQAEERLFAIRGLARKHNVLPDELGPFADSLRGRLGALDRSASDLADLRAVLATAQAMYDAAAGSLSDARRKWATKLDKAMAKELAPLKMERAVFATEITSADAGPDGADTVSFTVATNPGAPAGPIGKIASGGELSRFLLALKVCLTATESGLTLIFDEIDRGVGGATADAVGRRLSQLASQGQVLVVTHSPQVAALGDHHWRVEKRQTKDATLSTVVGLVGTDRVDEIARMLSGDRITDEARAAAIALLPV
ncbi:DNA repair protein RecN [Octadecabacter antarcticus 307]|uniref:DNA repair protein RecN n=1 Tax=Octadecabacter antarcticus 307 TaxID=391626 RepID=M9R9A2_9RHOB|nr:DNA repair protein RecN [Octadecabacter antarcticus]AGI66911.1 DNA repair protein RecN [Octadecabacter antarcticus 307]